MRAASCFLIVLSLLVSCRPQSADSKVEATLIEGLSITEVTRIEIVTAQHQLLMEKKDEQWFAHVQGEELKLVRSKVDSLLLLFAAEPRGLVMDYTQKSLESHQLSWPPTQDQDTVRLKFSAGSEGRTIRLGKLDLPPNPDDAQLMGISAVARRFVFLEEEQELLLVDRSFLFVSPQLSQWMDGRFHPVNRIQEITVAPRGKAKWSAKRPSPYHSFSGNDGSPLPRKVDTLLGTLFEDGHYVAPVLPDERRLLASEQIQAVLKFKNFEGERFEITLGGEKMIQKYDARTQQREQSFLGRDEKSSLLCLAARIVVSRPNGTLLEEQRVFISREEVAALFNSAEAQASKS